jgi:hypothetical protein
MPHLPQPPTGELRWRIAADDRKGERRQPALRDQMAGKDASGAIA